MDDRKTGGVVTQGGALSARPDRAALLLAFAAVYFIWGSTYLGIRVAIETLPPFLMAGVRFTIAGLVLLAWARARGTPMPRPRQWLRLIIVGISLLTVGNGCVVWSELFVPSGLVALVVTTVPLWTVLLVWLLPGGKAPSKVTLVGVLVGFAGMVLLIWPSLKTTGAEAAYLPGILALVFSCFSWTAGSIYAKQADLAATPVMATAAQMLIGGAGLVLCGLGHGDLAQLNLPAVSWQSLAALGYLIVFGSIIAYTAYTWLLGVVHPTLISTYAFVNPVVAVLLGWALAGEELTMMMLVAGAVIVTAVALIVLGGARKAVAKKVEGTSVEESVPNVVSALTVVRRTCHAR